ncbi:MAG: thioredoxin family protein [Thermoguttaceae bacterium]
MSILSNLLPKLLWRHSAAATQVADFAAQEKIEIKLEKVTDIGKIMSFGVMVTPALVVDGKVKCSGNLPSTTQLAEMLR